MYVVNLITLLRILGTVGLLFFAANTTGFLILYLMTGCTDVLDGWLARKTGSTSEFGAKLDSIADLIFYSIMLICIFPTLMERLHKEIWYVVIMTLHKHWVFR